MRDKVSKTSRASHKKFSKKDLRKKLPSSVKNVAVSFCIGMFKGLTLLFFIVLLFPSILFCESPLLYFFVVISFPFFRSHTDVSILWAKCPVFVYAVKVTRVIESFPSFSFLSSSTWRNVIFYFHLSSLSLFPSLSLSYSSRTLCYTDYFLPKSPICRASVYTAMS